MSRGRRRNGTNTMQYFSNAERRIGKQRLEELQSGCRAGVYSPEILKAACKEFEFIEPLILLSIRQGKSFDRLQIFRLSFSIRNVNSIMPDRERNREEEWGKGEG